MTALGAGRRGGYTRRLREGAALVLLLGALNGCASRTERPSEAVRPSDAPEPTVVAYRDYEDPLIGLNRAVFAFNDVFYRYLLIPLSGVYVEQVPVPVRTGVGNFFYNLKTPIYAVNNALQGEPRRLGRNLARFAVNTTLGLFGIFDPAKAWFDLERAETHFEQTLSGYGAGYGVYLVLPIFGPSDLRNAPSKVVDYLLNPVPHLLDEPEATLVQGFDHLQKNAPEAGRYLTLRARSEDPYVFFRNLYLQRVQRDADYGD